MDDRSIFQYVHGLYHEFGIQDLTVQVDNVWGVLPLDKSNFGLSYNLMCHYNLIVINQLIQIIVHCPQLFAFEQIEGVHGKQCSLQKKE